MTEKDTSQKFNSKKRLKIIKEIDRNQFLNNKNKKVCTTLNYTEHFLILVFAVTVCISISGVCFFNRYF